MRASDRKMNTNAAITVVSGLPRSGTSMMMGMLGAGGMELVVDNLRKSDEDNPKGYYEFEKVKQMDKDTSWMAEAGGKAVKIISMLLYNLPADQEFNIIFMQRDMEEVLASQQKMLERRGTQAQSAVSDDIMNRKLTEHLKKVYGWLDSQENMQVLYVAYKDIIARPDELARQVNSFLGGGLDEQEMVRVVDKSLYRQRK